jgi:hypothetical protein
MLKKPCPYHKTPVNHTLDPAAPEGKALRVSSTLDPK